MNADYPKEARLYRELWESTDHYRDSKNAYRRAREGSGFLDCIGLLRDRRIRLTHEKLTADKGSLAKTARGKPGTVFVTTLLRTVFETVRKRDDPSRNPYNPEVLADLYTIACRVSALALPCPLYPAGFWNPSTTLELDAISWTWPCAHPDLMAKEVPALANELEPHNVVSWIQDAITLHQQIATDPDFRHEFSTTSTGLALTCQHATSGMRTVFSESTDKRTRFDVGSIGVVTTKPNATPSICPESPPTDHIVRLSGLGIGKELYLFAAKAFAANKAPDGTNVDYRWAAETETTNSEFLRRKLHALDPFTWQVGGHGKRCTICEKAGVLKWREATRQDFKEITHSIPRQNDK